MKLKPFIIASLVAVSLSSCSSSRSDLTYFKDIDSSYSKAISATDYNPKVVADDELYIMVTSPVPSATADYNLPLTNQALRDDISKTSQARVQTYVVSSKGTITMPVLGDVQVAGLTTDQIKDKITKLVAQDVDDAQVIVRLVDYTVNVIGEVSRPGSQKISKERYTVLDAIAAAGDLTVYGERTDVLIIREEDGKRTAHRLDLTSSEILTSPYFYLQQNDFVYVSPNKIRQDNSKYNTNNAYKLSVISTIVSGCSVVASLIIALAL